MKARDNAEYNKNSGFTLIEVLVAIALLSLMLGPILSSFVSVARVNSTSRKKLVATTVAESLMESVKSFELSDVAKQCIFPSAGFQLIAGDLEKNAAFSGNACELKKDTSSTKLVQETVKFSVTRSGTTYSFQPKSDRCYYFLVTDIPMGGTMYDAIITYTIDLSKSDQSFTDAEGNTVEVSSILDTYSVRVLKYYDVTIQVYKAEEGTVTERLETYQNEDKALSTLTGTKADYN